MQKLQILFPAPQLERLRRVAKSQDRPVSELVRAAVDLWLSRYPEEELTVSEQPPSFDCGEVRVPGAQLREHAYSDEGSE